MRPLRDLFVLFLFAVLLTIPQNAFSSETEHTQWTMVCADGLSTLAIRADGTLWAWGSNDYGQLGDGTKRIDRLSPIRIGDPTAIWVYVTLRYGSSFGIQGDGSLWGWGSNINGKLGDGTTTERLVPVLIDNEDHWVAISSGMNFTAGIRHTFDHIDQRYHDYLYTWGDNGNGQLGQYYDNLGNRLWRRYTPGLVSFASWTKVSANGWSVAAIKTDDTLWGWGNNMSGQLGIGTRDNRFEPTLIGSADDHWQDVSMSTNSMVAIKDGILYGAGYNNNGHIHWPPSSTRQTVLLPVFEENNTDFEAVSADQDITTLALKTDGTIWAIGANQYGQFGIGTVNYYLPLTQLGASFDWLSISCGGTNTMRININGELYGAGLNRDGCLGIGSYITQTTPVIIDAP